MNGMKLTAERLKLSRFCRLDRIKRNVNGNQRNCVWVFICLITGPGRGERPSPLFWKFEKRKHKRKAEKKMLNVAKSHLPVGCAVNSGTDDFSATIAAALWVNTRQKLRHQNEARDERPGNQLPDDFVSPMSLKDFRHTSAASTVYYWLRAIFICFHTVQ